MSVKQSHRSSSSGSVRGLGGGSSGVTRVSSGSYRSPSMHGGQVGRGGCSTGSISLGLGYGGGSAGGFSSGFGFGGGSAGGFGSGYGGGSAGGFGSGFGLGGGQSGLYVSGGENIINEKETMQILNDRLANYLDKVRSLEHENKELDMKIREFYDQQVPYSSPDFHPFFRTIEELKNKILQASTNNANILLQIDNARLAADDFRTKYENEAALRASVECDINGLRRVLDELHLSKQDLEMHLQTLNEEITILKKNHEEEVSHLRTQLGARVNVEVNAAPAVDLTKVISEIRDQYDTIIANKAQEVEQWYNEKSEELNQQMTSSAQQLQTHNTEIIELRQTSQKLEIDLQTQSNMRGALESTLAETESRYGSQLAQIQDMITNLEQQLSDLRSDMERQNFEYKNLMDIKIHLEREITTYRSLLEGEDINKGSWYKNNRDTISSGSGGSSNMGGMGGMAGSGGSGGSGGMGGSGKPRTIVEDIKEGYSHSKN